MKSNAATPQEYIAALPDDRKEAMAKLRTTILTHLPAGYEETMSYGMIGYVVPHTLYPAGYHCTPALPLPFINIASQKNFVVMYHMGMYSSDALRDWFVNAFTAAYNKKPDMAKSCIRFKRMNEIPYELIGELAAKITPQQWIAAYEKTLKNKPVL